MNQSSHARSSTSASSELRRVGACALVGLVAALVTALWTAWELAVLVGWIVMTVILLAWIWSEVGQLDAAVVAGLV